MKKRVVKICVSILVFLLVAIGLVIGGFVFALSYKVNKIPNDDISKAIYKAVGRKKVRYLSKKSYDSGEKVIYGYVVCDYEDENLLANMVEAANAVMEEKEMTGKIVLYLWGERSGGYSSLISIRNYYEGEDGYEQYGYFQTLYIYGTSPHMYQRETLYDKISTYINLPDIKSLGVTEKIAQRAEEEGIDWYEIWPNLEHYEVGED